MNQLLIDLKYIQISYWDLVLAFLVIAFASFLTFYVKKILKNKERNISNGAMITLTWSFATILLGLLIVPSLQDIKIIENTYLSVNPVNLAIIVVILFANLFLGNQISGWFKKSQLSSKKTPLFLFKGLLWLITVHYSLKLVLKKYNNILDYELITIKEVAITVSDLIFVFVGITFTTLLILLFKLTLKRQVNKDKLEVSTSVTLLNISKYFVWTIALIFIFQSIGFNLSILLAGSAALLVGIGMGIQQLFNDFASGLILLLERQIKVGDYVDSDTISGTIQEIGFRTTNILTRDNIRVIIPNSILVSGSVINWSKGEKFSRFQINVGVAYGSDTQKVKKILLKCAKEHKDVLKNPTPVVQFVDFGTSSLDFKLFFYSDDPFRIEFTKSDIRFRIDEEFRNQGVEIPFTQMDVHFRNDLEIKK